jgi:hypothetical protein
MGNTKKKKKHNIYHATKTVNASGIISIWFEELKKHVQIQLTKQVLAKPKPKKTSRVRKIIHEEFFLSDFIEWILWS